LGGIPVFPSPDGTASEARCGRAKNGKEKAKYCTTKFINTIIKFSNIYL
jgi:hypothetical protein